MTKGINLLKTKEKQIKELPYQPLIRTGTIILILVYILVASGIVFLNVYFSQKEKDIQEKIAQRKEEIKGQTRVEALHLLVKSRLEALVWIFRKEKGKIGMHEATQRVRELASDRVEIRSVKISDFGNKVVLSGTVLQVTDLIAFFDRLDEVEKGGIGFESIYVSGLTRSGEDIRFGLTLTYSNGDKSASQRRQSDYANLPVSGKRRIVAFDTDPWP